MEQPICHHAMRRYLTAAMADHPLPMIDHSPLLGHAAQGDGDGAIILTFKMVDFG
jgi:hypothetical protein